MSTRNQDDPVEGVLIEQGTLEVLGAFLSTANRIRRHPIATGLSAIFVLASAFSMGVVYQVGFGLLPLIDKASMAWLLLLYISFVLVGLNLVGSLFASVVSQNKFFEGLVRRILDEVGLLFPSPATTDTAEFMATVFRSAIAEANRLVAQVLSRIILGVIPAALTVLASGAFALAVQLPIAGFVRDHWYFWLSTVLTLFFVAAIFAPPTRLIPSPARMSFEFARFFLVTSTVLGGVTWIDFLKEVGPAVVMVESGGTSQNAALLLPAHEGMIVYLRTAESTEYRAWSGLERIKAQ